MIFMYVHTDYVLSAVPVSLDLEISEGFQRLIWNYLVIKN
ncbi:hypothetical protein HMPREF0083_03443 [Aneurinibacillus aneurinilyticus ATCC 12856]|uniref:Uncharacterized protein n=1 Tax=Aneurinibacillus aneurinilyticus ATCC 12856 TaxID=649747 RepID=U1X1T4_ANEAE|nr:hypothetical protein HMPREF0083_03443 [Aneurinibacillus aneurinilyticus ATCC 12856]